MHVTTNATESCINISDCMTAEEIREVTLWDEHLSALAELVPCSWSSIKTEVQKELQLHWSLRNELAVTDGIAIKGRRIIITTSLQDKAIKQLHISYMGMEKQEC